jgi:hypothetical protein
MRSYSYLFKEDASIFSNLSDVPNFKTVILLIISPKNEILHFVQNDEGCALKVGFFTGFRMTGAAL